MKRKKTISDIAFLAAAVLLFSGCGKGEDMPAAGTGDGFTLTATIEQPADADDTKTSLNSDLHGNFTYWCANDQIIVFSGSPIAPSIMTTASTGGNGVFTPAPLQTEPVTTGTYYGFYPYTAESAPEIDSDGKITATLGNQIYAEGSFGANAVPMMAKTTNGTSYLTFLNVYGLMNITLNQNSGVSVSAICVTSNSGEYLSGKATIDYNDGAPTVEFNDADHRSTSVTLTCTTPVSLNDAAKTFYIAIPPTSSSATIYGYKIEVITLNSGTMTKVMPNYVINKLLRGRIKVMDALDFVAN